MLGHGLSELRDTEHGRILIRLVFERFGGSAPNIVGTVAVGKALSQVDRVVLSGEPRHDFEYGGAILCQNLIRFFHRSLDCIRATNCYAIELQSLRVGQRFCVLLR